MHITQPVFSLVKDDHQVWIKVAHRKTIGSSSTLSRPKFLSICFSDKYDIIENLMVNCYGKTELHWLLPELLDQRPDFLTLKEPKNRFQGTKSARLCTLACRYDNPIPIRFLLPTDCLKIPAQVTWIYGHVLTETGRNRNRTNCLKTKF